METIREDYNKLKTEVQKMNNWEFICGIYFIIASLVMSAYIGVAVGLGYGITYGTIKVTKDELDNFTINYYILLIHWFIAAIAFIPYYYRDESNKEKVIFEEKKRQKREHVKKLNNCIELKKYLD